MDEEQNTQVPVQDGDLQTPTDNQGAATGGAEGPTPESGEGAVSGTTAGDGDVTGNVEAQDEGTDNQGGVA